MPIIDTHELAKQFSLSGFSPDQTEALIAAFRRQDDDLVTKDFLKLTLQAELSALHNKILASVVGLLLAQSGVLIASALAIAKWGPK